MFGNRAIVHREFRASVKQMCGVLAHLGIGRGDRFAVLSKNSPEYVGLWFAGLLGQGILCPLNIRTKDVELTYILNDCGAKLVFCDAACMESVARIRSEVPALQHVVLLDGAEDLPEWEGLRISDILTSVPPTLPPEPDEDDVCLIMYTGGTTGLPKGVVIDQRRLTLSLYRAIIHFEHSEHTIWLQALPIFHVAALSSMVCPILCGGTLVLMASFDPAATLDQIEACKVTSTGFIPTMYAMIFNHPAFRPDRIASLRMLGYGGAPMMEALLDRIFACCPDARIYQSYGMTEASGIVTTLEPYVHRLRDERLKSVGRAVIGVEIAIRDAGGALLPAGDIGEIILRSGSMLKQYWNLPELTAKALTGGWYATGDVGYLDDQGYLFIVDRLKDMIISGGENIYSVEVENALSTHPSIAEVALIGVPHDLWGEAAHAVIVRRTGTDLTPEEVRRFAQDRLANFKVPKSFDIRIEPLPLSSAGKVLKRQLREEYQRGTASAG